jgi:pimeloyl-ACP methyl ester carboxylesterase
MAHGMVRGVGSESVPLIEKAGHRVVAPDLPGLGDDRTPLSEITLQSYGERICAVVRAQDEPVIPVGHSMGGMAINQVAEYCPEQIKALVYLCAFLPSNGDTLVFWAQQMTESLVGGNMVISEDESSATVGDEFIIDGFYGGCTPELAAQAKSRLLPQAWQPL